MNFLITRYTILILLSLFINLLTIGQLSITVISTPPTTPPGSDIYIAGNFNDWDPGSTEHKLTKGPSGTYYITLNIPAGSIEYKFTRGSWETVEGTSSGSYIPNRTYEYNGQPTSIDVSIAGWEGKGGSHTAEPNVFVIDNDFYMPQLDRTRRIWIYLPPDYDNTTKRYPVVYMHDGQNLFDVFYSFLGEWKIDESMNDLFDNGDYGAIVVGIDNGGQYRTDEYSPWNNPGYGGGDGELYASFLVNTLKPFIDSNYRTLSAREHTAIAGSSLGANISMYTAMEYQEVFSKAALLSPAFWFSDSLYIHADEEGIRAPMRFYFVAGDNESSTIVEDMMDMYDTLEANGQPEDQMNLVHHADGAHQEWYWAREYPTAYQWLFMGQVLGQKPVRKVQNFLYPNPAGRHIGLQGEFDDVPYTIYSPVGNVLYRDISRHQQIDISALPQGMYLIEIQADAETYYISRFIKQ